MSDLYIEARLQAIMEIADSACSDSKDIENINGFCTEIEDFLNKQDVPDTNVGDLISRTKLIRDLFYSPDGNRYPTRDCDNFPITISFEDLRKVINNQPQVQPINTDSIIKQIEEQTSFLKDCTKYGNKDAEQQHKSYSTMMMYEVADLVDDLIEIVRRNEVKEV